MKFRNTLLSALSKADFAALEESMRVLQFKQNQIVFQPGAQADAVHFPNSAVLSVITTMKDGKRVETATVGFESAVGIVPALSHQPVFSQVVAQVAGESVCIPASAFRRRVLESPDLMQLILRSVQSNTDQAEQSVACNALHQVDARLARWLLMTSDRVGGDVVKLTQEYLAVMVGVQRTTVTAACQDFKALGILKYSRGQITILDRAALERRACECYAVNRDTFARLAGRVEP